MYEQVRFSVGDKVAYAPHGVGEVLRIENSVVSGVDIQVYVVFFAGDRMTLRVPVNRAVESGLRSLAGSDEVDKVYAVLRTKPQRSNRMWSRRAQEYQVKINSGALTAAAEVLRDLYKGADTDRSYSEKVVYQSALKRLAAEIAVLEKTSEVAAVGKLLDLLKAQPFAA